MSDPIGSNPGLLQPLPPGPKAPAMGGDAQKTAQEFEAVFIGQMAKLMLESAEVEGEFGGGHGESIFQGVLAEEIGKEMAQRGGLGLAPLVAEQIIALQGGKDER